MFINGKNIEDFNARLMADPKISESNISVDYFKTISGTALTLFDQEFGVKELTFTLEFWTDSRNEAFVQKSNVLREMVGMSDIILTDGFIYKAILTSISGHNQISSEIIQVDFKMVCMQCGQRQDVSFVGNTTLYNSGTLKADCSLSFYSKTDIADFFFQINDNRYNISSLKANTVFEIDGIQKKINAGDENAIGLTDLVDFPRLDYGENVIVLSQQNVSVTVKYDPVFM